MPASSAPADFGAAGFATPTLPGVPPVLRDHLIVPYLAGRDFVRVLHERGDGRRCARHGPTLRDRPSRCCTPRSTSPAKSRAPFRPERPRHGRLIQEGVLGEALTRTLWVRAATPRPRGGAATCTRCGTWAGRTLVVWRTEWDTAAEAREFHESALRRFTRSHGRARRLHGADLFGRGGWNVGLAARDGKVTLVAGDDAGMFEAALRGEAR